MDSKRNFLIIALAVISYLMLLAWNEDYPAQTPAQITQESDNGSAALNDLNTTDLPVNIPVANNGNNDDLPQLQASEAEIVQATQTPTNLITITTPLQIITINPVGGDIVRVALPDYPTSLDSPQDPFVLLRNDSQGVYVAQSGLIGRSGPDASETGRPVYRTSQSNYDVSNGQTSIDLVFESGDNVIITKRFIVNADDYLINVQYLIENNSNVAWGANLFGQIKRDNSADPSRSSSSFAGARTYLGAVLTTPDDPYVRIDLDDMDEGTETFEVEGGWIGFSQHYFLGSWIPANSSLNTYSTRRNNNGEYILGFVTPETIVPAGQTGTIEAAFWAGPKDQYRLEEISPDLGLTIDYGMFTFVALPIFWLLTKINDLLGNFGWSIIMLTVVIKGIMYPLTARQYKSQANMKRLQPKITQLKERYGDDKQKFMQAQMELWKKEKVNPFGTCLPVLLQMPVFLGIYWVLNESVELRQAPFILWYQDLSAMDPFFVLPLLLGASYFLQQHLTPMPTTDPTQAKVMKFMPVMFTVFFLWFPAGLVLYYMVNAVLGILQQLFITSRIEKAYQKKEALKKSD